jgi:hypothetical protein
MDVAIIYELTLSNVMNLRHDISRVIDHLTWIWAFAPLKNIVPYSFDSGHKFSDFKNAQGQSLFGYYEGYVTFLFQLLGILVCFAASFVIICSCCRSCHSSRFSGLRFTEDIMK